MFPVGMFWLCPLKRVMWTSAGRMEKSSPPIPKSSPIATSGLFMFVTFDYVCKKC